MSKKCRLVWRKGRDRVFGDYFAMTCSNDLGDTALYWVIEECGKNMPWVLVGIRDSGFRAHFRSVWDAVDFAERREKGGQ